MLVAQGLRKAYRSREVVRDFGLTLDAGEVVVFETEHRRAAKAALAA